MGRRDRERWAEIVPSIFGWSDVVDTGQLLADLAFQYRVEAFIYSSSFRAGPLYEADLRQSGKAKSNIELHCKELGRRGLPWTWVYYSSRTAREGMLMSTSSILRPGFFLENFDGFIGSITASVLKKGLNPETEVGFIVSRSSITWCCSWANAPCRARRTLER